MKNYFRFIVVMIIALFFAGCAGSSKYMKLVPDYDTSHLPGDNKSLVVFMRPSGMAYAIQSSVFDATEGEDKLVGIVPAKKMVAYETDPGEHLFMVVGESADFMKADLESGKTYYALVTPRMGAWKARFSLYPVHKDELSSDKFKDWQRGCEYVENTDSSYNWARQNSRSIQAKKEKYLKAWNEKSGSNQPVLYPDDGL
ncbi:MAG: hypothetical protein AB1847_11295 [bacterium]